MRRQIPSLLFAAAFAGSLGATAGRASTTFTTCPSQTNLQNAMNSGGSVVFNASCQILLTSPINVPVSTTISVGTGHVVALDGQNSTGVITVPAGVSLTISPASGSNFQILNGRTASGQGGGIFNAGSLTLQNCIFNHNDNAILNQGALSVNHASFTQNFGASGGAIIHTGSKKAFITNSTFGELLFNTPQEGNSATQGGAIFVNTANLEVDNSQFYGNFASQGGAIYAFVSTVTLTGDLFDGNNTAPGGFGGAIANVGSTITVTNAGSGGFQSNSAPDSSTTAGLGGAVYNAGDFTLCGLFCSRNFPSSLTLNTVTLSGNSAGSGGAIYSSGNVSGCQVTVKNSYFLQNAAQEPSNGVGGHGGAIDNEGTSRLSVTGSTFQGNSSTVSGSDIQNTGNLSVYNSTLAGGFAANEAILNAGNLGALLQYVTVGRGYTLGIFNGGSLTLAATVLASGCSGIGITDAGYNLTNFLCTFTNATSITGVDPDLGTFGFNGGATPTFAVPTGAPEIDKIPPGTLDCGALNTPGAFDQRGVPRPQGIACDIGAIEHLFSSLPTSSTTCDGVYNKTFTGDIDVLPGQNCVFLSGGVTGNVKVHGGRFELRYAGVGGNVELFGDSSFSIGPSAAIGGNLEIHDLPSNAAQNQVCGASVTGNLEVHNNDGAVSIGAQDQTSCAGNSIGGILSLHNNSGPTSADGNTVAVDLHDHNNSGPTEVFKNVVTGALSCSQNSAITGGLDSATQKQGQCATF